MTNKNNDDEKEVKDSAILTLDDDFSLIKGYLNGNEDAFRTLIKRHKEKVRNLVYATLGKPDDVDDIAQEVFIIVFRKLHLFRFESQFTTWLYRITINKCRDHIRRAKIRSFFSPLSSHETMEYAEKTKDSNFDLQEIVRMKIAELPENYRIPLILRDIEGMNYQQIAETLNAEIGTVKSRIFRAREALRVLLEPLKKDLI